MRKNMWLYVLVVALAAILAMPAIGFAQGRGNSDNARGPNPARGAVEGQDHGGGKPETAGNRGGRGNSSVQGQRDGRDDEHGPPPHAQAQGREQDGRPTSTPGVSVLVGPQSQHEKVGICHVTGSPTNRYVFLSIPDHAAERHLAHHNKVGFADQLATSPARCEELEIQARAALATRATATATTTTLGLGATVTRTPTATATATSTPTATATSTPTATATATGTSGSGSVPGPGRGRGRGLALGEGSDEVETRVLGSTQAEGPDMAGMAVAGLLILGGTLVVRRLLAARR